MIIPRTFHQIWVGPKPFPDEFARYQRTWLDHHPGWTLRFWTEDNLPSELRRPEACDRLRVPAERADILRLEVLWRFGGVYLDADFECLRSIEPLIEDLDFFTAELDKGRVNNALIGSVAGHPILDRALDELRPREFNGYDKNATGPLFFDQLVKQYPGVRIFEKPFFYARDPVPGRRRYAIHHRANTWKDVEAFRIDAQKAARREEKAKEMAERWRRRGEEAEAELARVRSAEAQPTRRRKLTRLSGSIAAFAVCIVLGVALAVLGGYDAITRLLTDHDNFGDIQYPIVGVGWIPIVAAALVVMRRRGRRA